MSADISTDLDRAARLLREGEVVAIPTETVYGLAANALNADAVLKIFEVKNRPHFDPLIVHVASIEDAKKITTDFNEKAQLLATKFWPGPLTLVLKKKNNIPDLVTSGLDSVGIRMPEHATTLALLRSLDFPLAAPSANPFGYISPTSAQHVADQLGDKIPFILEGGACRVGIESTIIDLTTDTPVILRMGGISAEDIKACIGPVRVNTSSSSSPQAPGMLISHYAPRKKFVVGDLDNLIEIHRNKKIAVLSFKRTYPAQTNRVLSPTGDLHEAANNLFAYMRELDTMDLEVIIAEFVPEVGIGLAINDKLRRASADIASHG